MEKNNTVRTHRVGAFTSGFCMIGFGILLLLHNILDIMTYEQVLGLWPIILIGMITSATAMSGISSTNIETSSQSLSGIR